MTMFTWDCGLFICCALCCAKGLSPTYNPVRCPSVVFPLPSAHLFITLRTPSSLRPLLCLLPSSPAPPPLPGRPARPPAAKPSWCVKSTSSAQPCASHPALCPLSVLCNLPSLATCSSLFKLRLQSQHMPHSHFSNVLTFKRILAALVSLGPQSLQKNCLTSQSITR